MNGDTYSLCVPVHTTQEPPTDSGVSLPPLGVAASSTPYACRQRDGMPTRVMSAIQMDSVCEPLIRRRGERHLSKGRIVILAAGTGSPYFMTDSGAALRAAKLGCCALFKGTSVDGIYERDPKLDRSARRFDAIDYATILSRNLKVMDASAVAICLRGSRNAARFPARH
ncbi:MAG: uridine monophosphate kinase [Sphingopyxis sp.]|nr:uridine monophosphate kinase [Sphingopyxis sp.]